MEPPRPEITAKSAFKRGMVLYAYRRLRHGPQFIAKQQRSRLASLVAHARQHSAFYKESLRDLPERVTDVARLPITNKNQLMERFDDWVTDPEVTYEKARAFAEGPNLVGSHFLKKYTIATSSGTTGTPGIFVQDRKAMRVANFLVLRNIFAWFSLKDFARVVARGWGIAITVPQGGHAASTVSAKRFQDFPVVGCNVRTFSVHLPLPELVAQLNEFKPSILIAYASVAKLLAAEKEAGRLCVDPVLVATIAEGLPVAEYDRLARVFQAKVGNNYAAGEAPFLSSGCDERWLHVNSDWYILEPVDANYQPVPPGETSHTVLLTNLANRVQPVLRYDLGDRVVQQPGPCPCGNPLPAIRVQGRSADMLKFHTQSGKPVSIPPLAFEVDHIPGVELFQIVQASPTKIQVRLRTATDANAGEVWREARNEIEQLLIDHDLSNVTVTLDSDPPEVSAQGKFRTVIRLEEAKA